MGNFEGGRDRGGFRGGDRGGRPPFQKKSWGNDRGGDREVVMHKATCSECGKACEVPFRPSGEKPVYCNECFNNKRDDNDSRGGRKDFGSRAPKRDFNDRNDRPAPRPSFAPAPTNDEVKLQLSNISVKLDRLASAIEKLVESKKETVVAKPVPAQVAAPKKVVKVVEAKTSKKKVVGKKKK